jgi:predicted dehydrogenase
MDVAVLGTGGMGRTVIQHLFKGKGVGRVVAYDPRPEAFAETKFTGLPNDPRLSTTTDLETILSDPKIRLVFITASNAAHAPLTIASLKAGKAVFCEKPMATTYEDAARMVGTARETGGFLQIGFELRYSLLYSKIKQWIDQGLLGQISNTHCFYICSARERGAWRDDPEAGGSMFGEKLSHYVDLPRWWVGSDVSEVYSVCSPNTTPYMGVRDNYHTSYRFANGAVSHLTFQLGMAATFEGDILQNMVSQQLDDGHELRYLVIGDKGAAATDVFRRTLRRWQFKLGETKQLSHIVEKITWDQSEDHRYYHNTLDQTHDIVRRVEQGLPPMTPAADALKTMALCFAAEQSADLARPVFLSNPSPAQ